MSTTLKTGSKQCWNIDYEMEICIPSRLVSAGVCYEYILPVCINTLITTNRYATHNVPERFFLPSFLGDLAKFNIF